SMAFVNYRIGQFTLGGGDAYLRVPGETLVSNTTAGPERFNQFRVLLGYGYPNKHGFSGATNLGFDANLGFLQYSAVQTTYNWIAAGSVLNTVVSLLARWAMRISFASTLRSLILASLGT